MAAFLIIIFILVVIAAITVPIAVMYSRRQAREQKMYERGLKMVPMLIHLPPISDDTEGGSRDVRDLAKENISKAQVIYNIIASTYEKGFKRKIYGQQHFSFEIISSHGFVYFYTTVPIGLVEVVRQAIVSAYPAARLEEAEEHNIFSPVGKASTTTGGELLLKESFSYPIATYLDLERDAMQSMLNSLSTLGKEDGAAIQILMRPADPGWRSKSHKFASEKRKGNDSKGGGAAAFGVAKDFASAFVKPPEGKEGGGGSDKPELSSLEQQVLDAVDDKTRYPAYEVLIRVVASSNVTSRSQQILNSVVSAFSIFDAPGKNGFKFEPARDVDELITAYILKFFPQSQSNMILNSVELATIFHFPDQHSIPTSQLERQDSKQVDGPRNMPDEGLLLGYNVFRGVKKPIRLAIGDRQRHMYVVGQTGTGKSTFLENLALQDMLSGNGFAFVDPHGDTAEKLLSMVPKERSEDVIYFSPADMDYPMGLNLFEFENPDQKDFLIQEALNMLYKLYDPQHQGIMGPRYEHLFRNAALTVMADPEGGTFIDIPKLFRDPQYVKQKLQYISDPNVLEFWQKEMPQSQRSNEFGEVVSWFVSKFGAFLSNEMMRNIIGQTKSSFNLRDIMDNKKILLVNLSKGRTGDLNSKLLGMVFVMKFQAAAMSRANIPESQRVDFSLYVDEFQNFSTDSFATIMSEARKYHLNLIVANQFTTQLTEEIRDAVFGNMGTIVAFRIGQNDVDSLSRYFQPTFDGDDLLRVPNYNTITRTLVGGVPTQPFSMSTLPPLGDPNAQLSAALKQLSAAKFGRPKAEVEKEIFERIQTKEQAPAAGAGGFGAAANRPFGSPASAGMGGPAPAGASPWSRPPQPIGPATPGGYGAPAAQAPAPFGAASSPATFRPPAGPAAAAAPMAAPAPVASASPAPSGARAGTGSFLDEWLAKRGSSAPAAAQTPKVPASTPTAPAPAAPVPEPAQEATPTEPVAPAAPAPEPVAQNVDMPTTESSGKTDTQIDKIIDDVLAEAQPEPVAERTAISQPPATVDKKNPDTSKADGYKDDAPADVTQQLTSSPEADAADAPSKASSKDKPEGEPADRTEDVATATPTAQAPSESLPQPDADARSNDGNDDEEQPHKKKKRRKKRKKKTSQDGMDVHQPEIITLPGQDTSATSNPAPVPTPMPDAQGTRSESLAQSAPHATDATGVVDFGNKYDRNQVLENHVITEHDVPELAYPELADQNPATAEQAATGQVQSSGAEQGAAEEDAMTALEPERLRRRAPLYQPPEKPEPIPAPALEQVPDAQQTEPPMTEEANDSLEREEGENIDAPAEAPVQPENPPAPAVSDNDEDAVEPVADQSDAPASPAPVEQRTAQTVLTDDGYLPPSAIRDQSRHRNGIQPLPPKDNSALFAAAGFDEGEATPQPADQASAIAPARQFTPPVDAPQEQQTMAPGAVDGQVLRDGDNLDETRSLAEMMGVHKRDETPETDAEAEQPVEPEIPQDEAAPDSTTIDDIIESGTGEDDPIDDIVTLPDDDVAQAGKAEDEPVMDETPAPPEAEPETPPVDPDLALLQAEQAKTKGQHLIHGDTIYIDQEGNLKELEEENAGQPGKSA